MNDVVAWLRMRSRGRIVIAACVVLAVGIGLAAPSIARSSSSDKFLSYVNDYVAGWGRSSDPGRPQRDLDWVKAHPQAVLAEGRRACDWLSAQDDAPAVDPTGRSEVTAMWTRYRQESHSARNTPLATYSRFVLVTGAWNYLCSADYRDKTSPQSSHDD